MVRISLDGQQKELNTVAPTLKEVIGSVLSSIPENRVVTEIMLDGKQYYLHKKEFLSASPDQFEDIQIRTIDREVLADSGFDLALSNVRRVQQSLIHVAELFRRKDLSEGNLLFARCLDSLAKFIETTTATREVLKVDFSQIHMQNGTLALVERELNLILEGLMQCQAENDYQELADRIEYELLTNLHSWTHALHRLTSITKA